MIQNANYEFVEALNSSDSLPSILGTGLRCCFKSDLLTYRFSNRSGNAFQKLRFYVFRD